MGNIVENLNQINTIKENIKTSIVNKGGDLTGKHFEDYPSVIDNLPSGGGTDYVFMIHSDAGRVPSGLKSINNTPASNYVIISPINIGNRADKAMYAIPKSLFPITVDFGVTLGNYDLPTQWDTRSYNTTVTHNPPSNICVVNIVDVSKPTYINLYTQCFIKGTLVLLADRTYKKIQDVTYEDELLVWNFDKGCSDSAKPFWIKKEEKISHYAKITLENGKSILLTGNEGELHSLFDLDSNKFVHANELLGHNVMTLDGPSKIINIERFENDVEYYNIITNTHFNLYANDILASTSLNNLYPIKNMRFIYDEKNENGYTFDGIDKTYVNSLRLNENTSKSEKDLIVYTNNLISSKK